MGGMLALAVVPLTGFFICGLLRPPHSSLPRLAELPEMFGLGAVALFLVFLLASWCGPVALVWFYLVTALCGVAWFHLARHTNSTGRRNWRALRLSPSERGLMLVCGTLILVTFYLVLELPLLDWDTRILWALKSKVLTSEPTLGSDFFRNPYRLHIHPRYPVLVPFLASWAGRHQGGFTEKGYQVLISICAVLTLWQLLVLQWRLALRRTAFVLTLVMALSGVWINAEFNSGVEIVLCLFGLLMIGSLLDWQRRGNRVDLILAGIFGFGAAMTKNEGILLNMAALGALLITEAPRRGWLPSLRLLLIPGGVLLLLALGWIVQLEMIPAVSDEQYLHRLTPTILSHGAQRLPQIGGAILAHISNLRQWHLLWLILLYLPVAYWTGEHGDKRLKLLACACFIYLGGLLLIYVISPWRDVVMHIDVTFDRTTLPLLPLFILVISCGVNAMLPEEVEERGESV